jgi:fermentation-respiration switch protein FrsA (DUF1100 family)
MTAAGFIAGNYFYSLALQPGGDRSEVFRADHNRIELPADMPPQDPRDEEAWYEQSLHEDVYSISGDGLRLHASRIPHPDAGKRWAILCHGYSCSMHHMIRSAMFFGDMGFNILLPDARGCGASEGDYYGMGWQDRPDIVGWINKILEWEPGAQIVLYGVSMGGATVMMVSGEKLPPNVKAIVEDCGYTSAWDEFAYQLKGIFKLPPFPIMHFSSLVTRLRAGYRLGEASAVDQVAKSTTPTLFIHGTQDTFVPFSMLQQVYDACNAPKQLCAVEGAGHAMAAAMLGAEYWVMVERFIGQYIL